MPQNHIIKFRVTRTQHENILKEAQILGYITLSHYLRDLALNKHLRIETKIIETNKIAQDILKILQNERKTSNSGMD